MKQLLKIWNKLNPESLFGIKPKTFRMVRYAFWFVLVVVILKSLNFYISPKSLNDYNSNWIPAETPVDNITSEPTATKTIVPSAFPTGTAAPTGTPKSTNTPTPSSYSAGQFQMNGATISTRFPDVSLKAGQEAIAFTITSTGTQGFKLTDTRVNGVSGISFSPINDVISPGQTKNINVIAATVVPPGNYSGFVSIKVDSGDEQTLQVTIHILSDQGNNNAPLTITGPAQNSVYKEGDSIPITWEANNPNGNFQLGVTSENGTDFTFASPDNSARSYSWKSTRFFDSSATHFKFFIINGSNRISAPWFITINP